VLARNKGSFIGAYSVPFQHYTVIQLSVVHSSHIYSAVLLSHNCYLVNSLTL